MFDTNYYAFLLFHTRINTITNMGTKPIWLFTANRDLPHRVQQSIAVLGRRH